MSKASDSSSLLTKMSPSRIIIPILIGLGVTTYLIYRDLQSEENILGDFLNPDWLWMGLALLALIFRDAFYIYRIHYLTDRQLSWTGSFYTIILWEFSSALSPTAVGGTAVASFLLMKEGITFGKSLAYVLVSAILDNSYFIVFGGIVLILNGLGAFPQGDIFYLDAAGTSYSQTFKVAFFVSYSVIALYNVLMMYGLFVRPQFIKSLFVWVTSFAWFKRWQPAAAKQGEELVIASSELKGKGFLYWSRAIFSTVFIWTARYFIVNCLIAAYGSLFFPDHVLILSRHVLLWVILIFSVTPGAAGLAELAFKSFFIQFAGGMSTIIAVLWRLFTYYLYLLLGTIFLPLWIKRVYYQADDALADEQEAALAEALDGSRGMIDSEKKKDSSIK